MNTPPKVSSRELRRRLNLQGAAIGTLADAAVKDVATLSQQVQQLSVHAESVGLFFERGLLGRLRWLIQGK